MSLEKLIERIITDAEQHALRIIGDAQRERVQLEETADLEAEQSYARMVIAARRAGQEEKKQRVTMASLEARKSVLKRKQELIGQVFDAALASVRDLPDEQYVELMAGMLAASGKREGELILSPGDRERSGPLLVARANELLSKSGPAGSIILSARTREIAGGFILSGEGIEINYSLGALISVRREELEPKVVKVLFGDAG